MNNTELEAVAKKLHKVRVMARGAGLEQFYNMWRTATRDPDFLRTGCLLYKDVYPIRARKDYGVIRMVSEKVADSYYITNPSWDFGMWLYGSKLTLIGNNFKFKGAK